MGKAFSAWVVWFLLLLGVDFFVPFCLLNSVPRWKGSFLFWTIWIIVAIVSMFIIFMRWQEIPDKENTDEK